MDKAPTTLTPSQRDIITDLLEKWPKGPRGRYERKHYRLEYQWVSAYERTCEFALLDPSKFPRHWPDQPHVAFWGYNPRVLFELMGEHVPSVDGARKLVDLHEAGLSQAAQTKRARRLWSRLKPACDHVRENGMPGIWYARSWDSPYGSVWRGLPIWAETREEAEARIRVTGPMLGLQENWRLEFKFDRVGPPEDATRELLHSINDKARRQESAVRELEDRLARARKSLEEEQGLVAGLVGAAMLLAPLPKDEAEDECE